MLKRRAWLVLAVGLLLLIVVDRVYVFMLATHSAHPESPVLDLVADLEEFIEGHDKLLVLLATVAIAAFTAALWRATDGLFATSRQQVDHMRDTATRQLRAYVSVVQSGAIENDLTPGAPSVQIRIRNTGQTPAYDVKSWRGIGIHEVPLTSALNLPPFDVEQSDAVLGAGVDSLLPIRKKRPLTLKEQDNIKAGTHALYIWGRVEYRDAFGEQRYTNFRLYELPGGSGAGLKRTPDGNDAS